jgi:two-component system, sensor histidine kinase
MTATAKKRRPGGHDPAASLWVQAAHDLRQPVQAAQLLASALGDVSEPDRLKRIARGIDTALQSFQEMLEAMALLARIEAGSQTVELRTCELGGILDPALRELAEIAKARRIPLRLGEIRGVVRSDPKLLLAAARSLVLNAIRFGDGRDLAVGCRRRGDRLSLDIEFSGAALDAGIERHAFVQLTAPGDRLLWSQLGLGLLLVRRLCDALGHQLHHAVLDPDRQLLALRFPPALPGRQRPAERRSLS